MEGSSERPLGLADLGSKQKKELVKNYGITWAELQANQVFQEALSLPFDSPRKEGHVRFVAISDTHGKMGRFELPEGDVLLHCGDFSSLGRPQEIEEFVKEFAKTPFKHRIVIAGNHEVTFQRGWYEEFWSSFHEEKCDPQECREIILSAPGITYLEDSSAVIEGITIHGSPWSSYFRNWAFNLPPAKGNAEKIAEMWGKIPDNVDILMTHGPPLGRGDLCGNGNRGGCYELLKQVQNRIKPKVHLFGHIHEAYEASSDGATVFANVATCNKQRSPSNPPFMFDLPIVKP